METLFNSPDKFKSRFATVDGYKTHYIEAGERNPQKLLLVHGGAIEVGMGCYRWYANIIPMAKNSTSSPSTSWATATPTRRVTSTT